MRKRFVCVLDTSIFGYLVHPVTGGLSFRAGARPAGVPIVKFKYDDPRPGDVVAAVFYVDKRNPWRDHPAPPDWAYRNVVHIHRPGPNDTEACYRLIARLIPKTGVSTGLATLVPVHWAIGETAEAVCIIAVVERSGQ